MRYPSDSDVTLRLHETFIKYKGQCYYAKSYGSGNKVLLCRAEDKFETFKHLVDANDPEVDITSLEVGFQQINTDKVLYVCRAPFRKQKQGVCQDNLVCSFIKSGQTTFETMNGEDLYSCSFMNMLENKYPSYKEVHNDLPKHKTQRAFSKKLVLVVPGDNVNRVELYLNLQKIAEKNISETHWFLHKDYNTTTTAMYLASKGVPLY